MRARRSISSRPVLWPNALSDIRAEKLRDEVPHITNANEENTVMPSAANRIKAAAEAAKQRNEPVTADEITAAKAKPVIESPCIPAEDPQPQS